MRASRFLSLSIFCLAVVTMSAQSDADKEQKKDKQEVGKFVAISDSSVNIEHEQRLLEKSRDNDSIKAFVTVEQMPSFPGGEVEMHKYISENFKFPVVSQEEAVHCTRIVARFMITEDGSVSDVRVIRGCSETADEAFVKAIKMMPKWIPGRQDGKAVPVYFTLPMHIHLKF